MLNYDETEPVLIDNMIVCNGQLYSALFPLNLIKNPPPGTGPIHCAMCRQIGMWNGCFVMHCWRCSRDILKLEYGHGAVAEGVELYPEHPNSASNTYLRGAKWDEIGDKYLEDSHAKNCLLMDYFSKTISIYGKEFTIDRSSLPYTAKVIEEEVEEGEGEEEITWKIDRMPDLETFRTPEEEEELYRLWHDKIDREEDEEEWGTFDINDEY